MKINFFWFRRDLRLEDNTGLYQALKEGHPVLPVFIFDRDILEKLNDKDDARVTFIFDTIIDLKSQINKQGSDLIICFGEPKQIWEELTNRYQVNGVFANADYDHYSLERDKKIESHLNARDIPFIVFKDHVIFEKDEIVKPDGKPYTVFTPYKNKWMEKLRSERDVTGDSIYLTPVPSNQYLDGFFKTSIIDKPISLEQMGFVRSDIPIPTKNVTQNLILKYHETRDFPAINGTSKLGIHFRFGTISIREKARKAAAMNQTYLNELIWRDFYNMILYQFPHVQKGAFRPEYDLIPWRNDESDYNKWKEGKTGYPIVDAGMRELARTGYMHNRVRMIVASFLTKHLLIDWRWGEAWFAQKLLDYDLASNNGGWQWAAGCGTDAAPYFRIFSPDAQTKKFDPDHIYIKRWVPEFGTINYQKPIVDHQFARERCLRVFKEALSRGN